MKKLIIYGHPNVKSFNSAIVESYKDGAETAGFEVEILDIYSDYKQQFLEFNNIENAESTKIIQSKIQSADELCFIFPMRNFEAPAIIKNFWDINMSKGFAYISEDGKNVPLLKGKKGRIITTGGSTSRFTKQLYNIVFYLTRGKGKFGFCGMEYLGTSIHMDTMNPKGDSSRKKFLTHVYSLGMK